MGKKDRAFQPLMFIDQPVETNPHSTMQQRYSTLHDQKQTHVQNSAETARKPKSRRRTINKTYKTDEYMDEEETSNDEGIDKIEDQPFAELTLEEKILYCISRPSYLPKIMCMIKTENETIVGIIGKYEDGTVHIRPQKTRKIIEIPVGEIISIRMVGF